MSALDRIESALQAQSRVSPALGDEIIALARGQAPATDDEPGEAAAGVSDDEKAEATEKLGPEKLGQYMAMRKKGMGHGPAMKACGGGGS